jgi:phenylpropionate dioxygenase-like ring-hydroxylating dioxygenase large terminal subunit
VEGWPYTTFPTGWFQVEWSKELVAGQVKTLHYFDQDIVLYRTESGRALAVEPYCPHLGAHLGYGGCVMGENLRCPWHGWQWDTDGHNAEIAFVDMTHPKARLPGWELREIDGLVVVWYDALGRPPQWEFPGVPEYSDETFYAPFTAVMGPAVLNPQQPRENTADLYHFPFVHHSEGPSELSEVENRGHVLYETMDLVLGGGKPSTWLTPNGPVKAKIVTHLYGLGLGVDCIVVDPELTVVQVVAVTPVTKTESVLLSTTAGTRVPGTDEPTGRSKRMMESQHLQIGNDFEVWAHQKYVQKPFYAPKEGRYFNRVRSWAHQFYPADNYEFMEHNA